MIELNVIKLFKYQFSKARAQASFKFGSEVNENVILTSVLKIKGKTHLLF